MKSLKELAEHIKKLDSVLMVAHVSPDPDAVGSSCGLALGLRSLGIETEMYFGDPIPDGLHELLEGVSYLTELPERSYSALIAVDTASEARLGTLSKELRSCAGEVINIDHHYTNDKWGDVNWIDDKAAASAEIICYLLKELGVAIDVPMANLLYAGILDDTGRFSFSNARAETLQAAATLVAAGAQPNKVGNALYFTVPERVLKFHSEALTGLSTIHDGRISVLAITAELMEKFGASAKDTEGLVDEARKIANTIGAVFMRETGSGWKLSFRSKIEEFNVDNIARTFGGGGHRAAAGCSIEGGKDEVFSKVSARVLEELERL